MNALTETALSYLQNNLCVLPAILAEKRPALSGWKNYQERLPSELQVNSWFSNGNNATCILTGAISGNLEMIDFDNGTEHFERWRGAVMERAPDLLDRIVIEKSQSGGLHVIYRCESVVAGNHKLAQRTLINHTGENFKIGGKEYVPRKVGNRYEATITLIETRGEGGLFLCAPSAGYELQFGSFGEIQILKATERATLLEIAASLNETLLMTAPEPVEFHDESERPGDEFNLRGDVRAVLIRNGWKLVQGGENEYWRRPGKTSGHSATLKDRVFYVHSSNAAPFENGRSYSPFAVLALLEHAGDFNSASLRLRGEGYGGGIDSGETVDLSNFMRPITAEPEQTRLIEHLDPGPVPESLCRIPGFVSDVMDHCLETAPYPNVPLAFCGALALLAVISGRKVRDEADNRTNIYLLSLAYSATGKDWPRKLNVHILHEVGLISCLGEKFSSGEGIQDSLVATPAMLFQTDEIDGLLQSINRSQDARYENILGTLLTMYSTANSKLPVRRKAGKEQAGVIDQPCLVLYGTAIPTHYYQALSERMLTNGFFARMLIVESGKRSAGQDPGLINPPNSIMNVANFWAKLQPGKGNLASLHPGPLIVPATNEAKHLLRESRLAAEREYSAAEDNHDSVGTTVWGRVHEQVRKLSLLYAASANHQSPVINSDAVAWASKFIQHQTRRMLYMSSTHVSDNPFHASCLRLMAKLRDAPNCELPHSVLLKRMKMDAQGFQKMIDTLAAQGDLSVINRPTGGRSYRGYQLQP